MAKVRSNVLTRGVSGKFGNQVVFRQLRDGRTIMCLPPDFSNRKLSKDQKAHHQRFKEAAAYARDASLSNLIYAELAAGTAKNAYNVALSDWFHAPKIHNVEVKGGKIRIQASDNVQVASVKVIIRDADGKALEEGNAIPADELWWSYFANTSLNGKHKVEIQANDLAGNVTKDVKVLKHR